MPDGRLRVTLTDVRGRRIGEATDVILRHRTLAEIKKARLAPGRSTTIKGLHGRPQGIYHVFIDPPSYQRFSQFVDVASSGVTPLEAVCAVDPAKVRSLQLPAFESLQEDAKRIVEATDGLLGFEGLSGAGLLAALDPIRQAGFLNLAAKASQTVFANRRSVCVVPRQARRTAWRPLLRHRAA